jgi:hypothetical protein
MYPEFRVHYLSMAMALLILAAACNMPGASVGVVSTPVVSPGPPMVTATAPFQGAVPIGLPAKRADHAGDIDSHANAHKKAVSGGDVFVQGLYERPFNKDPMDKYFPYLDIVDTQGFMDDTWGYATITLAGTDANGALPGQYGVELDLDRNGRGDWLIRATNPTSDQWSTAGVQAWKDTDGDVGGRVIMAPDSGAPGGDGYETLVFDPGHGSLTDGAWARIDAADPKTVDIAFKLSMLGDPSGYAMGAWAATTLDPAMFDHNDHMTHIQAGSPNPGYEVYPLKDLSEIDNTCRLAIGFAPTGKELGLCETVQRAGEGDSCVPKHCLPGVEFCVEVTCP